MDYITQLRTYSQKIEDWLEKNVFVDDSPQKTIYESMRYSLMAGGKRIRPVLSLAVCDVLEKSHEMLLPFACALEMIHNYSLIHDDLPCMDNDDFRRGKPTNHRKFGESIAVLAGDGLLNLAFEVMIKETCKDEENCLLKAKAAYVIAEAAGTKGMIGGQIIDLQSEKKEIGFEQLCTMHQRKTGALIMASVLLPVVLFNGSDIIKNPLKLYSEKIGLAFQIKDDILDYEGNSDIVGKPTKSDEKNKKSTFVSVMGLTEAKKFLSSTVKQAIEALKPVKNAEFLIDTAYYIAQRDR